jgi:Tol biopolymer transport system component
MTDSHGKILFISNQSGNAQIHIMNHDGTGQKALTSGPEENTEPAWSPDGRRIAFTSYRDGNAEIYLMDNDGDHQLRLTNHASADNSPLWTSDGHIIFSSVRDRWSNFYVMDADGTNIKQLTDDPTDKDTPALSPDGKWLAFVSRGEKGTSEICIMPASGGDVRNLTKHLSKNKKTFPSWLPDSQRLAYVEAMKPIALNIRTIDLEGKNVAKITDNLYTNAYPVWSPDGKHIAFVSSREGSLSDLARDDIYMMNNDGSAPVNLTHHPAEDNHPTWSADGSYIYFVSFRDRTAQIYGISVQSGELQRLTYNDGYNVMIKPWKP